MTYIEGIKTNIKKHIKTITSTQVIIEIIEINLFFFIAPIITPKIDTTNRNNKIIVKLNCIPLSLIC